MTEREPVREEVLALEQRIIANPAFGERMIESMGSLAVTLSLAEFDLVCRWIEQGRSNVDETQQ